MYIKKKEEPLSEQQTFQRSSCIPGARDHIQETRQIFHRRFAASFPLLGFPGCCKSPRSISSFLTEIGLSKD